MSIDDFNQFHLTNTDSFVRKYLWDDKTVPEEVSRDILKKVEQQFTKEGWGIWKILRKSDQKYIGYAGLWIFFEEKQPQILYAIHKEFTGQGLASEATGEVIRFAFSELGFTYLLAAMEVENVDSIKLCERLGMTFQKEAMIDEKLTRFYRIESK